MADKEERILITKCSSHCHALRVSCDPFDGDVGMYCDKSGKWIRITEKDCEKCKNPVLLGLSRSEVIEKIAKALFFKTNKGDNWADYKKIYPKNGYIDDAEAALNSLLEVQK